MMWFRRIPDWSLSSTLMIFAYAPRPSTLQYVDCRIFPAKTLGQCNRTWTWLFSTKSSSAQALATLAPIVSHLGPASLTSSTRVCELAVHRTVPPPHTRAGYILPVNVGRIS